MCPLPDMAQLPVEPHGRHAATAIGARRRDRIRSYAVWPSGHRRGHPSASVERTITDACGQNTIEIARHYARGADLRPKMRGVVAAFDTSVNERRKKAVKPAGRTVKP